MAYRSGAGVALAATAHTRDEDRFVDAAGRPLSSFDPLEVEFDWGPPDAG